LAHSTRAALKEAQDGGRPLHDSKEAEEERRHAV